MIPWNDRPTVSEPIYVLGLPLLDRTTVDPAYSGKAVMEELQSRLDRIPGIFTEVSELAQGPAQGKPVHLRIKGESLEGLQEATTRIRAQFEETPGLIDVEDTLPLPGID